VDNLSAGLPFAALHSQRPDDTMKSEISKGKKSSDRDKIATQEKIQGER
jgi:hypothetical protein